MTWLAQPGTRGEVTDDNSKWLRACGSAPPEAISIRDKGRCSHSRLRHLCCCRAWLLAGLALLGPRFLSSSRGRLAIGCSSPCIAMQQHSVCCITSIAQIRRTDSEDVIMGLYILDRRHDMALLKVQERECPQCFQHSYLPEGQSLLLETSGASGDASDSSWQSTR